MGTALKCGCGTIDNTAADPPVSPAPAATQLSSFTPAEEVAGVTARSQARAAPGQPSSSLAALPQH